MQIGQGNHYAIIVTEWSLVKKQLSEMSLEELWELFPIVLKEHNPQYKNWYETEKQNILKKIKADDVVRINHIGSSAVEGLLSKPTVDMLLEIDGCCNVRSDKIGVHSK